MEQLNEPARRALKRMLANGPLAGVPKRPADQQLLVELAATRFDPQRTYREAEANGTLEAWIGTFCEPQGLDHVTLRRMLVDSRLMSRTKSGSTYRIDRERFAKIHALAAIEPAEVLAEVRGERQARKRERAA